MEKITTFEQFSDAVEALAGDQYFAVRMEKTKYPKHENWERESAYQYVCYVNGYNWCSGGTPELAIYVLSQAMGIGPKSVIEGEIK